MFSVEQIKSLNELELSIYNYVLANLQAVQYMKIRELAENTHVSTTSILRFCKKFGCDGYSEFKVYLKEFNKSNRNKKSVDCSELIHFLKHTDDAEFHKKLDDIAEILRLAKLIVFVGTGNTSYIAQYAARYFANNGSLSFGIEDSFYPVKFSNRDNVIVVALSISGETKQTVEIVNKYKIAGCKILSITASTDCTLAKIADYQLSCYVTQKKKEDLDFTSQVPFVYLIEQLGSRI